MVAKRRTVVTFGLVFGPHVSKSVNSQGDRGGRARETQNCRDFWGPLLSSRLKSANSHGDRGGHGRETQNCRHFWGPLLSSSQNCQQSRGSGGSWSRNAELSSLLGSSFVFAPQKRQQSRGSGGSWSRNAELSSLLGSSFVFVSKLPTVTGIGGVVVAKRKTVVTYIQLGKTFATDPLLAGYNVGRDLDFDHDIVQPPFPSA